MKTKKITDEEIAEIRVSSLPTRPTAPSSFGGRGFTAAEIKSAFDRLPAFIIERFNSLLTDIESVGEDSISSAIKTGLSDGHSLCDMLSDIGNGNFANYLSVGDGSLASELAQIKERLSSLEGGKNE